MLVCSLGGWLENRSAETLVDGVATDVLISAGVPQGSPISPALFLLLLRPLYERLRRPGIVVTGFADDTSLLAAGPTTSAVGRSKGHTETLKTGPA